MKSIEDLKLVRVSEDCKKWVRDIYFEYNGEEQYVELSWEEDYGYTIVSKDLTDSFSEALEAWHETTDELFESMLDDLTWQHVKKGN
jgi:hypothetical protein